jgi:hypothetical protein
LQFVRVDDGTLDSVVWPSGISTRFPAGRSELVGPDGIGFATDGDVISGLEGGIGYDAETLICLSVAYAPRVGRAP